VLIAMTCKPYRTEVVEAVDGPRTGHDGDRPVRQPRLSPIIRAPITVSSWRRYAAVLSVLGVDHRASGDAAELCHRGASEEIVERVERFHRRRHQLGIYTGRSRNERCRPQAVRSLAARYYTDPAIFEAEKAGLLARTWQFAGHASQLENPGDYFTFEMAGESLFCIRGRDGVIRTFYNVCQHRAHQLVSGEGNARVVCPYHAWTYELTGELRAGAQHQGRYRASTSARSA
jgi:nitrite reductase/ring-hydroxylating ferredoxin subunit